MAQNLLGMLSKKVGRKELKIVVSEWGVEESKALYNTTKLIVSIFIIKDGIGVIWSRDIWYDNFKHYSGKVSMLLILASCRV